MHTKEWKSALDLGFEQTLLSESLLTFLGHILHSAYQALIL